jgi:hypothetical protein
MGFGPVSVPDGCEVASVKAVLEASDYYKVSWVSVCSVLCVLFCIVYVDVPFSSQPCGGQSMDQKQCWVAHWVTRRVTSPWALGQLVSQTAVRWQVSRLCWRPVTTTG